MQLSAAANLIIPAYLALQAKGYAVRREQLTDETERWIAEGRAGVFRAGDLITLLGVVAVAETRGENWEATDDQIDRFLKKFHGPNGDEDGNNDQTVQ